MVGAPNKGGGAAYVFTRNAGVWSQVATLPHDVLASNALFGSVVAVSGSTIAVAAPQQTVDGNTYAGIVCVYTGSGSTWAQEQVLTAADEGALSAFGTALALDGDTLVATSPGDSHTVQAGGAAYVFTRSGGVWTQQKVVSSDLAAYDNFGYSAALDGDTLVVGAVVKDAAATDSGAAYVFTRSAGAWSQQAELLPADGAASNRFGESVAVDGDTAVVGATYHAPHGAAYVFTRTGAAWSQQAELQPAQAYYWSNFGKSVSLDGPLALIGSGSGVAAPFVNFAGTWVERAFLTGTGWGQGDAFGTSVSVSGTTGMGGAGGATTPAGAGAGAAYSFDLSGYLVRTIVTGASYDWSKVPVTLTMTGDSAVGTIVSTEYQCRARPRGRLTQEGSWSTPRASRTTWAAQRTRPATWKSRPSRWCASTATAPRPKPWRRPP